MRLLFALLAVTASLTAASGPAPIIFVHGNGDDASRWMTTIWRFESNDYLRDRLFAIRFPDPVARNSDDAPLPHHSSTIDQASELSAEVARVMLVTGAAKVILIGSSRGGLTIRNYIKNAGGAFVVSHAILCGTPNHGVFALPQMTGNEFNGKGPFLSGLNASSETVPGVRFLTIRSDHNDKYAQPEGRAAGLPLKETGVTSEGPALAGAQNIVIPGLDHRETAFDAKAFAVMYRFITGNEPATLDVIAEPKPAISGLVTGFAAGAPTNLPVSGARVRITPIHAPNTIDNKAIYDQTTDETGAWGPVVVNPTANYEFVVTRGGVTTHFFRSPFSRSSIYVDLRLRPGQSEDGTIIISRPQGYLSKGRDAVLIDGKEYEGLPAGVPSLDEFHLKLPAASPQPIEIRLRDEVVYARPGTGFNIAEFNRD